MDEGTPIPVMSRPGPVARAWWHLAFDDAELEAAFWVFHHRRWRSVLRGSIAGLYVLLAGFAIADVFVFPEVAAELWLARGAALLLMLPVAPFVFLRATRDRFEVHAQEVLLWLSVVAGGSLFPMAALVLPVVDRPRRLVILLAALFAMTCIYGLSGLRFRYAVPFGVLGTVAFFVMYLPYVPDFAVPTIAFLVLNTVLGIIVCWSLESSAREGFLRTVELRTAAARSRALLLNVMPATLAARLERGELPVMDRLQPVTVMFASLVGFERSTADRTAIETVRELDDLVGAFDALAQRHEVERIKTIGTTYMAAAGVPMAQGDDATRVADLALAIREEVRRRASQGSTVTVRVGIASGEVVCGVVGRTRLCFDVWGDTANLASRLDTHGEPDRIQVSATTAARLPGRLPVATRGSITIKGKGAVEAFWLS